MKKERRQPRHFDDLAYRDISGKWTMPLSNWALISQQLAIKFGDRFKIM